MKATNPLISVIVPAYNAELYLEEAIQSIYRQQYEPIEIIIIDDGSTDRTADIAKSFGNDVIYIYQENKGPADARNRGIKISKGQIIAFLDADDLWTPDKLITQISHLANCPKIQYTVARVKFFLQGQCSPPSGFRKELLSGEHIGLIPGTLMVRKKLLDIIGGFNTEFDVAEDVDWFARANDAGVPMTVIPKVLVHKRVHDSNLSFNALNNNQNLLKILRRSVERRRKKKVKEVR